MNQLGIGAMIGLLSSSEASVKAYKSAIGKRIAAMHLDDDAEKGLRITFDDEAAVEFYDDARSCCESRYMYTDDPLQEFVGAQLIEVTMTSGPTDEDEEYGDTKECLFLNVKTSAGTFVVNSYNTHNGYYGGIRIVCRAVRGDDGDE